MSNSSTAILVNTVRREVETLADAKTIKSLIWDSTNNHRNVSVNQVIRYLGVYSPLLSLKLSKTYSFLLSKGFMKKVRRRKSRTDAYDITEFFTVMDRYVLNDSTVKGQVSKLINQIN